MEKKEKKHIVLLVLASFLSIIIPAFVIVGLPFIILISEANTNDTITNVPEFLKDKVEIDIKGCKVKENIDTYFLGDGEVYITLDCSNKSEYITKQISNWNKLPLSNDLADFLYDEMINEETEYSKLLSDNDDYTMPSISNGYYYFVDKQNKKAEKHSDKYLFDSNRYDYNYYIAIYDEDTNKLYYIEADD